jgi:hypothetical protein
LLFHGQSLYSRLIGIGQSIPWTHPDQRFAYFTHAALVGHVTHMRKPGAVIAEIVEAENQGVVARPLEDKDFNPGPVLVKPRYPHSWGPAAAVGHAYSCVGDGYDWSAIMSIALRSLTGGDLGFSRDGRYVCSALVAECLFAGGISLGRPPYQVMPADLAQFFHVLPPERTRS